MRANQSQNQDQLTFNWDQPVASDGTGTSLFGELSKDRPSHERTSPQSPAGGKSSHDRDHGSSSHAACSELVRVMPWDFRTSFPPPPSELCLKGVAAPGDDLYVVIKEFHLEQTRRGLELLAELDWIIEAQRMGLVPDTGLAPPDPATRDTLDQRFENERAEHDTAWKNFLEHYSKIFGELPSEFFGAALRVWHLGGTVITKMPPVGMPTTDAVQAARFGYEDDGSPVNPDDQETSTITEELAGQLRDVDELDLRKSLLDQYATDFGEEAARRLDQWTKVINQVEEDGVEDLKYDPGHPWHYYHEGDAREPMPVDDIPPAPDPVLPTAPRNPKKRLEFFRRALADQEQQLAQDKHRYRELIDNGPDALSDYDRNIAHDGNDELAWASAMALKFNHIRHGLGRVTALRLMLAMPPRPSKAS